ncbi:MAG: ABC transporter ATP-binding protein [Deltaproteobacteria bacterium]|nr:ABC transporter ATP-binding protein [Deltaproteobacteria bacterium]
MWQLAKSFPTPQGDHVVVEGFDLAIGEGDFVSIIGHSGCGKSTVLSMVAGLTAPTFGVMVLAGREVKGPGPDRGVVFQSPSLFEWMTARQNIAIGVDNVFAKKNASERRAIVEEHLALVGLAHAADKKPAELSLGMRQRVGLARAFALDPKVLLLDEPFGMLDSITRLELQEVLVDVWSRNRKTALMVTHDVDEALCLSDKVVMMTSGPCAKVGGVLEVPFARPRDRETLLEEPAYRALRDELIGFLEAQAHTPSEEEATALSEDGCEEGLASAST